MRRDFNKKLIVPAFLAVTACGGGDKPSTSSAGETETTGATQATTATTTAPTTGEATTGETTTAPTTTSADTTDTGSDTTTGELPDCSKFDQDMAACEATVGCVWDYEVMNCIPDCFLIKDEATCNEAKICFWSTDTCYPPI